MLRDDTSTYAIHFTQLAQSIVLRIKAKHKELQQPHLHLPKLFNELRHRYASRPGGYTRVLRIEPIKEDQAPSAILELVDGPKDMRFAMTARTIARDRELGRETSAITALNVKKVTRFREKGEEELESMVRRLEGLGVDNEPRKRKVYPDYVHDEKPKKARHTNN